MEEEKIIGLVRENYGLRIKSIEKIKNSYKINLQDKSYFLKVINYRFKHFNFILSAIIHLQKNKFKTIPEIIPTVFERNYIRINNSYAYLMEWVPSREVNYDNIIELKNATRKLAELHNCSQGFNVNLHMKPRIGWFTWVDVFQTRKDEILDFKFKIEGKKCKDKFDKLYLSCLEEEVRRADRSINTLKESNYLKLMIKEYEKKGFCHHDYANHNILIDKDNNINIIDFDYCILDSHLHDLASLMIRVMKNGKWNRQGGEEIIKNYSYEYPINEEELFIMKEFIRYPQIYWQLGIQKYWEKQSWKEEVFIDRLTKYMYDREDREEFLKTFI